MSFPAYASYKHSGMDWLGEIPAHWETCALKRLVSLKSGESITAEAIDQESQFPVYGGNGLRGFTDAFTHDGHYVLIGRQGALCGNINYASGKFWASEHALVASPFEPLEPTWLGELLTAMNLNQYSVSAAQPGLSAEAIGNLRVPLPPVVERGAIGSFVSRETAKIDALVDEQRRLIELLKEKRQAVISHAVTKGLDPNAPMKDSGVAWLGQVPEHWEVKRIKHFTRAMEQGWSPQCESTPTETFDEWAVLKVGCVNGGMFDPTENKLLPTDLEPVPGLGVVAGDLLISRANTRELVGSAAVAMADYPKLMVCDKLYRIRCKPEDCDPKFVARYLGIAAVRGQLELSATGASSSMLNIGQSTILDMPIVLPPIAEQVAIDSALDQQTSSLNELISGTQSMISLAQERRTALISAAVTGKIDVRGAAPVEAEAA